MESRGIILYHFQHHAGESVNHKHKTMKETPTTEVVKKEERSMEFVPFGAKEKIKLSVAIIQNLVAVKTRSGRTCSEQEAIKFMMMCQARLLNPFEGDAYLIGYDGRDGATFSLITAHQAFLKRAEVNPEYDGMKSGIIIKQDGKTIDLEGDFYDEGQVVVGGWATVYFKNRKNPMHKRVRLARFQKAFGVWQDDAAGMICKCAEADALRSSFPTMLGGLYMKEEIREPELKTSSPEFQSTTPLLVEPQKVVTPIAAPAAAQGYNKLKAFRGFMDKAAVKEEQVIAALLDMGVVDETVKDLSQVTDDVLEMLDSQHDDFLSRIKEGQ